MASSVPWAVGFKPPTRKQSVAAIEQKKWLPSAEGSAARLEDQLRQTSDSAHLLDAARFHPLPKPTSIDDWLAQYVEPGQTVSEFAGNNPWISSRRRKGMVQAKFQSGGGTVRERYPDCSVYIVCLGSTAQLPVDALVSYTEAFWGLPVKLLDPIGMPGPPPLSLLFFASFLFLSCCSVRLKNCYPLPYYPLLLLPLLLLPHC